MKTAVILFNLGGPLSKEDIKPFLFNFFMDKNIIGAPKLIRYLLAKYIAKKRSGKEAGSSYAELDYCSPLLKNSQAQAVALEKVLNQGSKKKTFKAFVCMRYWHPMTEQIIEEVITWNPDKIILLPLYPQFSTTTTGSSYEQWQKVAQEKQMNISTHLVCCYPFEKGFIKASASNIKEKYNNFKGKTAPRVLFSAHGLPEKIIQKGDPYQYQCEQTAKKIVDQTGIKNLDWQICYQSRVGPLKWIGPSTEEALKKAATDQRPVLIYPHAFVSEHVETLVEIEIEYRDLAKELGVTKFERVPTVGTHKDFIAGLANTVNKAMLYEKISTVSSNEGKKLCPAVCKKCMMDRFLDNPLSTNRKKAQ